MGLHVRGVRRPTRDREVDQAARLRAAELERKWDGRYVVLWSPYRRVYEAYSAIKGANETYLVDSSIERLGHHMALENHLAIQRAEDRLLAV